MPFMSWKQEGVSIKGDATGDYLRRSVALSADASIIVIGSPGTTDFLSLLSNGNSHSGYIKDYRAEYGGNRVQLGQTIHGDAINDYFGFFVDITPDGMTIICGSPAHWLEDRPGYVRVFSLQDDGNLGTDNWTQIGQDIIGEAIGDQVGSSVSISTDGKTFAVGADWNNATGYRSGHVRVYRLTDSDTIWEQIGQDIDGEAAGDMSGTSVSLSAD